jgi:hypothetical protein
MVSGAVSGWVNIPTRISAFPTRQPHILIFIRSHHIKIAERADFECGGMASVTTRCKDQGQRPGAKTGGRDRGQRPGANAGAKL